MSILQVERVLEKPLVSIEPSAYEEVFIAILCSIASHPIWYKQTTFEHVIENIPQYNVVIKPWRNNQRLFP